MVPGSNPGPATKQFKELRETVTPFSFFNKNSYTGTYTVFAYF